MATKRPLSASTKALIEKGRRAINRDMDKLGRGEVTPPMRNLLLEIAEGLPDGPSKFGKKVTKKAIKTSRRR